MAFIALFVFVALIGGMSYAVYRQFSKTDPSKMDTSTKDDISTAQEFLQFEDIKNGMFVMGGHQYRAVIECSSTNYYLKTGNEKDVIEISFQRFINSLTFPITFFIQTKMIDNSKMMTALKEELQNTVANYPQLENYANIYFSEMNNLSTHIDNNKQKKKYIIVPFEEAQKLQNLNDQEKFDYSSKEIYTRASMLVDGLSSLGIKGKILNTKELAELAYSAYHKDNYAHVENIVNGEFLTMMVEGETSPIENVSEDARLDWILYEAQMRIQTELLENGKPSFASKNLERCLNELNQLRDQMGGFYKERADDYQGIELEKEPIIDGSKKGGKAHV